VKKNCKEVAVAFFNRVAVHSSSIHPLLVHIFVPSKIYPSHRQSAQGSGTFSAKVT